MSQKPKGPTAEDKEKRRDELLLKLLKKLPKPYDEMKKDDRGMLQLPNGERRKP